MDDAFPAGCSIEAWRPAVPGIIEVFHAHIIDFSYPLHSHDSWTVLLVDDGAIDYALDTKQCAAERATVAILPPGVVHDGQPADRARHGFRKRNLYLEPGFLPDSLIGAAVDKATLTDPGLRAAVSGIHDSLKSGEDALDSEARLALVAERLTRHLDVRHTPPAPAEIGMARKLRDLLDEHNAHPISLNRAATLLERSVPHLVRSFTAAFGISPHAYIIGRRIEAARPLLLQGIAPAEVAAEVGFYDQAHLNRHFKRHTATTPARYTKSHRR